MTEFMTESEVLQRKEKRLVAFILVFFSIGVTILFISFVYFIVSMSSVHGDATETTEFIRGYEPTWNVLKVLGSSLTTTAFILVVWWINVRGQRRSILT